jgi:CHAT domain-containing protein
MFVGESLLIRGRRAGRDRILRSLPGADVFHFAGHAFCDWTEPLDSGLLCATRKDGADTVRVRDLLALARSVDTRLIVLSACQIGNVQAGDKQNDFINLPSALLAAGARAVIAPRWLVNDVATSMFLTNLFEHWLCKGESLPIALFSARQWLRDRVTRSDVERWLEKRRPDVVDLDRLQALKNTYVEKYRPDERPFDHVAHWGAFELTGDPYPFGGKTCLSLY